MSSHETAPEHEQVTTLPRPGAFGLPWTDVVVLGAMGLIPATRGPWFASATLPARVMLTIAAPAGAAALARRAWRGCLPSRLLVVFCASAGVSTVLARSPLLSLRGAADYLTPGLVGTIGCLLLWALARDMTPRAIGALPWVFGAVAALNGLVGLAQISLRVDSGPLASFPGRAAGLMFNPVYYASFLAGVTAWSTLRPASREWNATAIAFGYAFALGLSGSRIAMAGVLIVAAAVMFASRAWRMLTRLGATSLGFLSATLYAGILSGSEGVDRVVGVEGIGLRARIWRFGWQAVLDRPVFGWGTVQFREATAHRVTADFVRAARWNDKVQPWDDPHNLLVMSGVSYGLIGTALLAAFVVASLRGHRNLALVGGAFAIALTWLLQPSNILTMPAFAVYLGSGVRARRTPGGWASHWPSTRAPGCLLMVGGLLALVPLVPDVLVKRGLDRDDTELAKAGVRLSFADPDYEAQLGSLYANHDLQLAERWFERASRHTPQLPTYWVELANVRMVLADYGGALAALNQALEIQPNGPSATSALAVLATLSGDIDLLARAEAKGCELALEWCSSRVTIP